MTLNRRLNRQQMRTLLTVLAKTRKDEVDCDYCQNFLAEIAERELQSEKPDKTLDTIFHHLEICIDCAEELELLKHCILSIANAA